MTDRHILRWTTTPPVLPDLPPHITRHNITTPQGGLELLVAQPPTSIPLRRQSLFFVHGGFGSASVWLLFLSFFSQQHGFRCYALSLRGHGASWKPGFMQLVFGTGKRAMAADLGAAIMWVDGFEAGKREGGFGRGDLVLVGHSAGGGLVQYFLSEGLGIVGGLVVLAGFPCFGGLGVYWNWFKLDPWFAPRLYFRDLLHPRSPLSSTSLVHRAFFGSSFSIDRVRDFERYMPEYESLAWPLGMMLPFVHVQRVLMNIVGWQHGKQSLLIVAGEKDTLMGVSLMRRMSMQYQKRFMASVRKSLSIDDNDQDSLKIYDMATRGDLNRSVDSVRFAITKGSGHHVQNDLQWEECANQVLDFLKQL